MRYSLEYSVEQLPGDGVDMIYVGTTVVHRARYWPQMNLARTSCGIEIVPSLLREDGEFTEDFLLWLSDFEGVLAGLCCHCRDRKACWEYHREA